MRDNEVKRELAEKFDTIMDTIHADILITDGEGKVLRVSHTFEKLYGLEKDKAIGRSVYALENEGYFRPSVVAMVLESGEKVTTGQKVTGNRDVVVTATPIRNDDGEIQFVVSYTRDITEMLELQKEYSILEREIEKYKAEINKLRNTSLVLEDIAGESAELKKIIETIDRVSDFDVNILLSGPSGVGKTTFAKLIHKSSTRKDGPFIDINCAAIPENLLESELFGYEKGAFTGANDKGKVGLIELAHGGTLLLDEISEMPVNLQAKLLKTIQDKVITRVGGTREINVDFRLIAASNRDLAAYADQGKFREDLFYRLNVVNITIPPLIDRREDILPLCDFFLDKINRKYNITRTLMPKAKEKLYSYCWPGNVRQLANVLERAAVISSGYYINEDDIQVDEKKEVIPDINVSEEVKDLEKAVAEFESRIINDMYEKYKSSTELARRLNISQPTASRKISRYVKEK